MRVLGKGMPQVRPCCIAQLLFVPRFAFSAYAFHTKEKEQTRKFFRPISHACRCAFFLSGRNPLRYLSGVSDLRGSKHHQFYESVLRLVPF